MSRFVGIDPSTKLGLVILDEEGNVLLEKEITTKETKDPQRFINISDEVLMYLMPGDTILIEGFSYGSKGRGVSTQYGIGWQIRTDLVKKDLPYVEVTPGGLKKFATGKGNASKESMILPLWKKWGYENDSDNVRDAFTLAMIGRYMNGLENPVKYERDVIKAIRGVG